MRSQYLCLSVFKKKNTSVSFPLRCPLFWIARKIGSAWYQFTGSFSHSDTHTQFTPWGENECLYVIQQPPRSVLALTRGTCHPPWHPSYSSRRSETSAAALELTQLFLHNVVLVAGSVWFKRALMHGASSDARHALCHDKKDYERAYTYSYKQDERRLTVSSINRLWFWNWNSCILLWLRFAAVGLHTIASKPNRLVFL